MGEGARVVQAEALPEPTACGRHLGELKDLQTGVMGEGILDVVQLGPGWAGQSSEPWGPKWLCLQ